MRSSCSNDSILTEAALAERGVEVSFQTVADGALKLRLEFAH